MFAQYSKSSPLVQAELDLAMNKAYLPPGAQTVEQQNQTGSDMALNDAARDFGNMKAQPAVVQWAVLSELRSARLEGMQSYAALKEELNSLPLSPETTQRRTEISAQLDSLAQRDSFLLSAAKKQILDMGSAGTANQLMQRETYEGMGESLGLARLSGKGISSAEISGRVAMLKGAVAEANAAVAEAKAIAQAKIENAFYRDGGIADPTKPISVTGPWKSTAELTPPEADTLILSSLPSNSIVSGRLIANVENAKEIANGYQPPYISGTQVFEITTTQTAEFVRVFGGGSRQVGSWVMRGEDVKGLTPEQIASKFSLPQVPTMIGDVTIPAGTKFNVSAANGISPNADKGILTGDNVGGGGVQFQIQIPSRNLDPAWFSNARPLK